MAEDVKNSKVAGEIKKEYLKEHLENIQGLLENWIKETSTPPLFAHHNGIWGWQYVYKPSSEQDPDTKHMLKRHLRSRTLWRHHTEWEVKLLDAWNLIIKVRKDADDMLSELAVNKKWQYTEDYINTALWRGFQIAYEGDLKRDYTIPVDNKGISFGAYKIEGSISFVKDRDLVKKEHLDFSDQLAGIESMKSLAKLLTEIKEVQQSMHDIAIRISKSRNIFYPCRFCKHFWK